MKPFLKWVGGKHASVDLILSRMPPKFDAYHDRFFGGGAVFFALAKQRRFERAFISDINEELFATLVAIRDTPAGVCSALAALASDCVTSEMYAEKRDWEPSDACGIAARMIFLNKTCFNGLYRVNRSGRFNSPWGKVSRFAPDLANIMAVSGALQGVDIRCCPFNGLVSPVMKSDVVYLDPPYFPVSSTANFTAYSSDGFGLPDQLRVAAKFAEHAATGATVLASNADVPQARAIYGTIPGIEIVETSVARPISCKASTKGKVGELLFVANGTKVEAK